MYLVSSLRSAVSRYALAAGLVAAGLFTPARAQGNFPSAADGYDPNANGNVYALTFQPDGKLLVGGSFTQLQPNGALAVTGRSSVARLNADGSPDALDAGANGPVYTLALQADGKILLGGNFSTVQPTGAAVATARGKIARLNADGSLDASFQANLGGLSDTQVSAIAVQPDGRILVGGTFTTVQGTGDAAPTARAGLVRLNANGSIDASFTVTTDRAVYALAVRKSGGILVGGSFSTIGGVARNRLALLSATGVVDPTFDPNAGDSVNAILLQPDGQIVIGGAFLTLTPNGAGASSTHSSIARLNPDGSVDTTFNAGASSTVTSFALQGDGKILASGQFLNIFPGKSSARLVARSYVGRYNADGSVDETFNAGANAPVAAVATQANGTIILGGYFTQLKPPAATFGTVRNRLARVNADGTPDKALDLGAGGGVLAVGVQSDNKTVIGGTFTSVGGVSRNYLARLNADGTLDTTFNPGTNGRVVAILIQSDGKILIGGIFTLVGIDTRNYVARLNSDGSVDKTFNPNPNGGISAFAQQSDGKIILGGAFSTLQPNFQGDTYLRGSLARVNADGSMDTTYDPEANGQILAIKVQSDGKAVIGGLFTTLQPNGAKSATTRLFLARLAVDGTVDSAFVPEPDNQVNALAIQSDGKIIAGGAFLHFRPNDTTTSPVTRNRIARLNSDGSIDSYNPDANDAITTLLLQPDGKLLVAGSLTSIAGETIFSAARLNADGSADVTFNPFPSTRVLAFGVQSDASVLISGTFTSVQPGGSGTPRIVSRVARFTAAGAFDGSYSPGIGGLGGAQVNTIALQTNGKFIVGGSFADLGGNSYGGLARFQIDGTPDPAFAPALDGPAYALAVRTTGTPVTVPVNGFAVLNPDGTLRTSFAPGADTKISGQVFATNVQSDGKILVGGVFINGTNHTGPNFARFYPDGSLDGTLNPGPNGTVNAIAVQGDGRVILGGDFGSTLDVVRSFIARYNLDGTLDTGFNPNLSGRVSAIAIQPADQKVIAVGSFTSAQPNGAASITTRQFIARFNPDGTLDTGFNPNANGAISTVALQPDGKILIGGTFTTLQPNGQGANITRQYIARLNADGTLDSFDPEANSNVNAIAVQADGKVVIGGYFTTLQPNGSKTILPFNYLARLNSDGTADTSYLPNPNAPVLGLSLQGDGRLLAGGSFTSIAGTSRSNLARLAADGTNDASFDPGPGATVNTVQALANGTILVGGTFSTVSAAGSLYVAGLFNNVGGVPARNLALLNDDGTVNTNFLPNPNNVVYATALQGDGQLVFGGAFTVAGGQTRNGLARVSPAGILDTTFNPNVTGTVSALALQSDGSVLLGGSFTRVAGTGRNALARVSSAGVLDSGYNPNADGQVYAIAAQPNGKAIVGGAFTTIAGASHRGLARLNADGSLDGTFGAVANGTVSALELQADGHLIVGGSFTTIGGLARNRLARLNPDGSVDPAFDPNADAGVYALALQGDGKVFLGGAFGTVGGLVRPRVARVATSFAALESLQVAADFSAVTWVLGGASPLLSSATFEYSTDAVTWKSLGIGTAVAGGGSSTDAGNPNFIIKTNQLPGSGVDFFVRARGLSPAGGGGSASLVEIVQEQYLVPQASVSSAPVALGTTSGSFIYAASATNAPTAYSATGLPEGLSIDASTGIISGTAARAGTYTVLLSVTNAGGTSVTPITLTIADSTTPVATTGHLLDLSCLAQVKGGNGLITGFVIAGPDAKSVLLRAVGPGLAALKVPGPLAQPQLQLLCDQRSVDPEQRRLGRRPEPGDGLCQRRGIPAGRQQPGRRRGGHARAGRLHHGGDRRDGGGQRWPDPRRNL